MTDEEAGTRILTLLKDKFKKPGGRQVKGILRNDFKKTIYSDDDFLMGLRYAAEKGWIKEGEILIELTEKGFNVPD